MKTKQSQPQRTLDIQEEVLVQYRPKSCKWKGDIHLNLITLDKEVHTKFTKNAGSGFANTPPRHQH